MKKRKSESNDKIESSNKKILIKVLMIVKKIVQVLIFAALICFVLIVCLQRFSNNKMSFLNYRMFAVVSGSMEPKYSVGDILIAKEVDPATIKIKDEICYLGQRGSLNGMVITHQVVGIEKDTSGNFVFRARGLANLVEDPLVYQDQLYGKIVKKSDILTTIYKVVGTKLGMFIFVFIPIAYIIGSEFIHSLLDKEAKRRERLQAEKTENNNNQ